MDNSESHIQKLKNWILNSQKIVFFGGAGVSTESGIPDFRSQDGLYNQKYAYPPEVILSHSFFKEKPLEFFAFYRDKLLYPAVKPNIVHRYLTDLERNGKQLDIVTQNIDGLHQAAGSRTVWELHGSVHRNYCEKCKQFYSLNYILETDGIPYCSCGGIVKPDVVLYGEPLNSDIINASIQAIQNCDMLFVAGTSLSVYPAAGFLSYYCGNRLVLVNKDPTDYDKNASLLIHGILKDIVVKLTAL